MTVESVGRRWLCYLLAESEDHQDYFCNVQTNPIGGKACSPTKGGFICLYMPPLLPSQTSEFVICISIYIRLQVVTL